MKPRTKARIAELEADLAESNETRKRLRETLELHRDVLRHVLDQHQPITIPRFGETGFELRCQCCHAREHSYSAPDNVPWPCPTIAPFVALARYATPEDGEEPEPREEETP